MSRRPSAASLLSRARILSTGALLLLGCWMGCELDRSGLSSSVTPPAASGGQTQTQLGTGGIVGTGGSSSIHFGTGGVGTGGRGTGGSIDVATGGAAGTIVAGSGGNGVAGHGTGGVLTSSGGAGGQPAAGKGGGPGMPRNTGGSAGMRASGRGGSGTGGWWSGGGNSGSGGWNWGTGGSGSALPMCDATIRDKDPCDITAADCRKTCGVSELGTKPCTCTNRQWSCGDCAYPSGDYSCYQLPASGSVPPCPPNTVNGMTSCFGDCTLCANYTDTSGMPKMGYCACNQDPGDSQRLYHCASAAEWPPQ